LLEFNLSRKRRGRKAGKPGFGSGIGNNAVCEGTATLSLNLRPGWGRSDAASLRGEPEHALRLPALHAKMASFPGHGKNQLAAC
jgi:hypothetical protein